MIPQSRMGTAYRNAQPGGIRAPTGYKKDLVFQSNLNTTVNVFERPISNHGVTVLKNNLGAQRRQIADKSYFATQLKQRNQELLNETAKMNLRIVEIEKGREKFKIIKQKIETANKTARELEGNLADYNLTLDKHRVGTKANDISGHYEQIKMSNNRLRQKLDELFIKRKDLEGDKINIEQQINEVLELAKVRVNELDTRQREEYYKYDEENKEYGQKLKQEKMELEEVNGKLIEQENRLRMDGNRLKVLQLKEMLKILDQKKRDYEVQLNEGNLPIEEIRSKILEQIRVNKEETTIAESRVRELRRLIDSKNKEIYDIESELNNKNNIKEDKKQNYEVLYNKEKEIDNFLNNYNINRQNLYNKIEETETKIQKILELSSKMINAMVPPTEGVYDDVNNEKKFKDKEVENSERTLAMVKRKLAQYQQESRRLNELEETLPLNIKKKKQDIIKMKNELNIYSNIKEEEAKLQKKKEKITDFSEKIVTLIPQLEQEFRFEKEVFDSILNKVKTTEMFYSYSETEKKMIESEQLLFNIKNFILTKRRDNEIDSLINKCEVVSTKINDILINKKN